MRAITVALIIAVIAALAILTTPPLVQSRVRPTPTPCETIVEGLERCGQTLRTAQTRPNQKNVPRRATPTRRPNK